LHNICLLAGVYLPGIQKLEKIHRRVQAQNKVNQNPNLLYKNPIMVEKSIILFISEVSESFESHYENRCGHHYEIRCEVIMGVIVKFVMRVYESRYNVTSS